MRVLSFCVRWDCSWEKGTKANPSFTKTRLFLTSSKASRASTYQLWDQAGCFGHSERSRETLQNCVRATTSVLIPPAAPSSSLISSISLIFIWTHTSRLELWHKVYHVNVQIITVQEVSDTLRTLALQYSWRSETKGDSQRTWSWTIQFPESWTIFCLLGKNRKRGEAQNGQYYLSSAIDIPDT